LNDDSPEHIFVHLGRTMDEDDPEISPGLGKLPGEDEAIVPHHDEVLQG